MQVSKIKRIIPTRHNLTILCIIIITQSTIGISGSILNIYKCLDSNELDYGQGLKIPASLSATKQDLYSRIRNESKRCETGWMRVNIGIDSTKTVKAFRAGGEYYRDKHFYTVEDYCLSSLNSTLLVLSYCEVVCGKTHNCVPKCCGVDKIYDTTSGQCTLAGVKQWSPKIYSKSSYKGCGQLSDTKLPYHIIYEPHAGCSKSTGNEEKVEPYLYKKPNESELEQGSRFRLIDDGGVVLNIRNEKWQRFESDKFCIDGAISYPSTEDEVLVPFTGSLSEQFLYLCVPNVTDVNAEWYNGTFKSSCIIAFTFIGIIFLICTVIIYLLLWEKHNIHGWTVFSFVISLLLSLICLAGTHIIHVSGTEENSNSFVCKAFAILFHFCFLCTLCWMSIINVDLWLTFRSLAVSTNRRQSVQRYISYATFATAIPLLIVSIGNIVDVIYTDLEASETDIECGMGFSLVAPRYGQEQCTIEASAQGVYLYIPMGILLSANIIMFSSTVFTLWRYQQNNAAAIASSSSSSNAQKQSFLLFCKLFIVMGLTWVMELISWACSDDYKSTDWYIWITFDIINLLQAGAVFFIFAFKRENLIALQKKYPKGKTFIAFFMGKPDPNVGLEQTEMTSGSAGRYTLDNRATSRHTQDYRISNSYN